MKTRNRQNAMIPNAGGLRAFLPLATFMFFLSSCGADRLEAKATPRHKPLVAVSATPQNLETAIKRGVDFLVKNQRPNGSWGSSRIKGGVMLFAPISGGHDAFKAACTALSIMGLIESEDTRPEVTSAINRGATWLLKNAAEVKRSDIAIYCVWSYAYTIRACVRLKQWAPDGVSKNVKLYDALIAKMIKKLASFEYLRGGWGYYAFDMTARRSSYSANSFTTATVVIALKEAEKSGHTLPKDLLRRAYRFINSQRVPNGGYMYSSQFWPAPYHEINRPSGSLARSQSCNLALYLNDDKNISRELLGDWVGKLISGNAWLDQARKTYMPHEGLMAVAGYFYYYGHYYGAQSLELLDDQKRHEYSAPFASIILTRQEKQGSWLDYVLYDYGHYYATPYAIMALVRCRGFIPEPPTATEQNVPL